MEYFVLQFHFISQKWLVTFGVIIAVNQRALSHFFWLPIDRAGKQRPTVCDLPTKQISKYDLFHNCAIHNTHQIPYCHQIQF